MQAPPQPVAQWPLTASLGRMGLLLIPGAGAPSSGGELLGRPYTGAGPLAAAGGGAVWPALGRTAAPAVAPPEGGLPPTTICGAGEPRPGGGGGLVGTCAWAAAHPAPANRIAMAPRIRDFM